MKSTVSPRKARNGPDQNVRNPFRLGYATRKRRRREKWQAGFLWPETSCEAFLFADYPWPTQGSQCSLILVSSRVIVRTSGNNGDLSDFGVSNNVTIDRIAKLFLSPAIGAPLPVRQDVVPFRRLSCAKSIAPTCPKVHLLQPHYAVCISTSSVGGHARPPPGEAVL